MDVCYGFLLNGPFGLFIKYIKGGDRAILWRCSQKSLKPNGILGTNQVKRPYDLPGPVIQCVAA